MVYAILDRPGHTGIIPTQPALHSWEVDNQCVARFLTSLESDRTSAPRFGENADAIWCIQGQLFVTDSACVAADIDVVKAMLSGIPAVCHHFWGTFLIIVYNKRSSRFLIFCDPCGQYPVFYRTSAAGSIHVGTEVKDFIELGDTTPQPNLQFLHEYLANGYGSASATGLLNLSLLPPGQILTIEPPGNGFRLNRAWSPSKAQARTTPGDFTRLLSAVLDAMIAQHDTVFLELSGGVESTALAVALHQLGLQERVVAVTHFDPRRASSNEVAVARAVAQACGLEHRTFPLLTQLPFAPSPVVPVVARPSTQLCFVAQSETLAQAGLPGKAGTLLNGHGGDALFLAPPPFGVPLDAATRLRVRRAITAIRDLAIAYRMPLWCVLKQSIRASSQFFSGAVGQRASAAVVTACHDEPAAGLYDDVLKYAALLLQPARRYQIAALGATLDETVVQVRPTARRPILPFLSQPVVEHALGLRTEDLFSGYHNRLPVRRSAYEVSGLPNLWRTDKGDTAHSALQGIRVHHAYIRDICLGGRCVSEGLVNPRGLEKLINRAALGYPTGLVEITRVFATEIFLQGVAHAVANGPRPSVHVAV